MKGYFATAALMLAMASAAQGQTIQAGIAGMAPAESGSSC